MSINRRTFTAVAAASGAALVVMGPEALAQGARQAQRTDQPRPNDLKEDNKAKLAKEPFSIGAPARYREPGLYQDFKRDKGVWIISDGKTLVAMSATCTHLACTTHWDPVKQQFKCPCHNSRFSLEGINQQGSKAKRPLERCSVRLAQTQSGVEIVVDPTRRLRQDKGEWSDPAASAPLT